MFITGSSLYGYLWLSTPLGSQILSPVVKSLPRVKWFDYSVDTMWMNYQNHRHSEDRSASGPIFIRGFPLDGYLMTLYTPCCAYFIAPYEIFRLE